MMLRKENMHIYPNNKKSWENLRMSKKNVENKQNKERQVLA